MVNRSNIPSFPRSRGTSLLVINVTGRSNVTVPIFALTRASKESTGTPDIPNERVFVSADEGISKTLIM